MFFWKILCAPSVDIITNNGLSEKDEMASGGQAFIIQYSGSCIQKVVFISLKRRLIFYCKMIVEDIARFLFKESALPNCYFVLQTARSTLLQKEKKPPIKLNNVRYQTCSCLQLPSNKYKKISCQDTQFTDTLKIINPHSPIAYGHITMAYPTFFFWCVHTHRISIQSLTTDLNSQKHTYCI